MTVTSSLYTHGTDNGPICARCGSTFWRYGRSEIDRGFWYGECAECRASTGGILAPYDASILTVRQAHEAKVAARFDYASPHTHVDTLRMLARSHRQGGYTATDRAPSELFPLPSRWDLSSEDSEHAWYLDSVYTALSISEPKYALRALLQACKGHKHARGPAEHDALISAQNRVEALLEVRS